MEGALLHNRRSAHSLMKGGWFISRRSYRREVTRMWGKRFFAVLRFLVVFIGTAWILTIKAC